MKNNNLIKFLEDCLLIDNSILVIGDMHIGYEEHIFEQGLFPRMQLKQILEKFDRLFAELKKEKIKLKKIVLLGDLKHEFGGISDSEWRETLQLLDYILNKCKNIVLIRGNHDNILGSISKKREIKIKNFYKIKIKNVEICFLHGNKLFKPCLNTKKNRQDIQTGVLIMGHLHPSVTLRDNYKSERFKCFLVGKWKNKEVYILPSFSPISFGYDISSLKSSDEIDGFIIVDERSLRKFEVLVYNHKEDKIYNFGEVGKLIKQG